MLDDPLPIFRSRSGHFLYESGHHGDTWFDLETLCLSPVALQPHVRDLADIVARYHPQVVCGPLVEGAYVALLVAQQLGCEFVYANRESPTPGAESTLFPIQYRIPDGLHSAISGKRVAICNDMINAGSAVRGAYLHLRELGADVVLVASLAVRGTAFRTFALEHNVRLETLVQFPANLWTPDRCPLCDQGEPLQSLAKA